MPVLILSLAGCSDRPPVEPFLKQLNGRLVADDGVYVVPDRGWRREGPRGGSFRKTAALLVVVGDDRPDRLRFTFNPSPATERLHFEALWDEEPLWERPRSNADEALTATIGGDRLSPGLHRLRLVRLKDLDDEADRGRGVNLFTSVEITRTDAGVESPQGIFVNPLLARFLDFGVASIDLTRLSGALFVGPQQDVVELDGAAGSARFTLQNRSRRPARFTARVDGAEPVLDETLAANTKRMVDFEISSGGRQLMLETQGQRNGSFLWGAPHLSAAGAPARRTVLLITLDTTRRDAVAPYSERPELTPNIARLAGQASVYTNAYATSPWTLPSHASIFTGMYPSHHRAGVTDDVLDRSWLTLAERFRDAGYRTAAFIGGHMTSSDFGMAQGFSVFREPLRAEESGGVLTDEAVELIDRDGELPLFLFVNYFDPHAPYAAPAEFNDRLGVDRLGDELDEDTIWGQYARDQPGSWKTIAAGRAPNADRGLAYLRARYDAEVAFMDAQIGRLFSALEDRGLFDDALIVLVADHGEYMGERGLFQHSYRLDPELTAVPLLIKWPGQRSVEVVEELVSHVDLYPAIAAAAGLDVPPSDGLRFGYGSVQRLGRRDRVVMEEHKSRFHQLPGPFWIADHLLGLQSLEVREVLYSGRVECQRRQAREWIHADCGSSWGDRLPELSESMRSTLTAATDVSSGDLDPDDVERLRALGYLD